MARTGDFAEGFVARLAEAPDPREVARILREVNLVGLSHAHVRGAGDKLPGYSYDPKQRRYLRLGAAAVNNAAAIDATLPGQAERVAAYLEKTRGVDIDKRLANWRPVGAKAIEPHRVTTYINQPLSPAHRAARVRGLLMVTTASLASANAHGQWVSLPNGNLGAAQAAEQLAAPLGDGAEPVLRDVPEVKWEEYPLDGLPELAIWRRRECVVDAMHPQAPVEKIERGAVIDRRRAARRLGVFQDAFFVVDPEIAADVTPADLSAAVEMHGAGMEDMVVPVAGYVIARQAVELVALGRGGSHGA